jgi:hypothetical protein
MQTTRRIDTWPIDAGYAGIRSSESRSSDRTNALSVPTVRPGSSYGLVIRHTGLRLVIE